MTFLCLQSSCYDFGFSLSLFRPSFVVFIATDDEGQERFTETPEVYKEFLGVLHDYQKQTGGSRVDEAILQVKAQVQRIFAGHPDLVEGFTVFLPSSLQEKPSSSVNTSLFARCGRACADMNAASCHHRDGFPQALGGASARLGIALGHRFSGAPEAVAFQSRPILSIHSL